MGRPLPPVQTVYFLGIGGIGMSALARHALALGWTVGGYDKTPSGLTDALQSEGAWFTTNEQLSGLPSVFNRPQEVLIVWTPAIPANHPQLIYFKNEGFSLFKRAEVLAAWANEGICVAVGGTHGKTTTSSLLAWILHEGGTGARAFLGGVATNFGTNCIEGTGPITVVEADEFDRSFLHLSPSVALVTSTDADHLDIYGTAEGVRLSFETFAQQTLQQGGRLLERSGLHLGGIPYGVEDSSLPFYADNLRLENGHQWFDLHLQEHCFPKVRAGLPGRHNIENAVGAAAAAFLLGVPLDSIAASIGSFRGVARRFDVQLHSEKSIYVDDYAHHPTEIRSTLTAARQLYPNRALTVVFQPHLYSRTKDFMPEFATALSLADVVFLLPIYPARELPLEGITSEALAALMPTRPQVLTKEEMVQKVAEIQPVLLMSLGAGDIDRLVADFKRVLS